MRVKTALFGLLALTACANPPAPTVAGPTRAPKRAGLVEAKQIPPTTPEPVRARRIELSSGTFMGWDGSTAFYQWSNGQKMRTMAVTVRSGEAAPVLSTLYEGGGGVFEPAGDLLVLGEGNDAHIYSRKEESDLLVKGPFATLSPAHDRVVAADPTTLRVYNTAGRNLSSSMEVKSFVTTGGFLDSGATFTSFGHTTTDCTGAVLADLVRGQVLLDFPDACSTAVSPSEKIIAAIHYEEIASQMKTLVTVWRRDALDKPRTVTAIDGVTAGHLSMVFHRGERQLVITEHVMGGMGNYPDPERIVAIDVPTMRTSAPPKRGLAAISSTESWSQAKANIPNLVERGRELVPPTWGSMQRLAPHEGTNNVVAFVDQGKCNSYPCDLGVVLADPKARRVLGRVRLPNAADEFAEVYLTLAKSGRTLIVRYGDHTALVDTTTRAVTSLDEAPLGSTDAPFDETGTFIAMDGAIYDVAASRLIPVPVDLHAGAVCARGQRVVPMTECD